MPSTALINIAATINKTLRKQGTRLLDLIRGAQEQIPCVVGARSDAETRGKTRTSAVKFAQIILELECKLTRKQVQKYVDFISEEGFVNYAKMLRVEKYARKQTRDQDPMFRVAKKLQANPLDDAPYLNSKAAYEHVSPMKGNQIVAWGANEMKSKKLARAYSAGSLRPQDRQHRQLASSQSMSSYGTSTTSSVRAAPSPYTHGGNANANANAVSGTGIMTTLRAVSDALLQQRTTIVRKLNLQDDVWRQRRRQQRRKEQAKHNNSDLVCTATTRGAWRTNVSSVIMGSTGSGDFDLDSMSMSMHGGGAKNARNAGNGNDNSYIVPAAALYKSLRSLECVADDGPLRRLVGHYVQKLRKQHNMGRQQSEGQVVDVIDFERGVAQVRILQRREREKSRTQHRLGARAPKPIQVCVVYNVW